MKNKELNLALEKLSRVLRDPSLQPVHRDRLVRAKRELQVIKRSGKINSRRIGYLVRLMSETLFEAYFDADDVHR